MNDPIAIAQLTACLLNLNKMSLLGNQHYQSKQARSKLS